MLFELKQFDDIEIAEKYVNDFVANPGLIIRDVNIMPVCNKKIYYVVFIKYEKSYKY